MSFEASFKGGRALVTGGADGIGWALARAMTDAGLRVAVLDVRAEAAEAAAARLGPTAMAVAADVSDPDQLTTAAEQVRVAWGGLEVLWINAGVAAGTGVTTGSRRAIEWVVGVNVLGVAWTAQAFLPLLRAGEGQRAVGVTASSAALRTPAAPFSLYAASKHATLAFAEAMSAELAPEGIGTTVFCPGLLNTDIWNGARARPERFGGPRLQPDAAGERWRAAETPERAVAAALATMAEGGGYCVAAVEADTREGLDARAETIRAGFR